MKVKFITITIGNKCIDLPKDMQIPQKGSVVFIDGESGTVDTVNYHITDGKVNTVSIMATEGTVCRRYKPNDKTTALECLNCGKALHLH